MSSLIAGDDSRWSRQPPLEVLRIMTYICQTSGQYVPVAALGWSG
jgi:hypothetical protein